MALNGELSLVTGIQARFRELPYASYSMPHFSPCPKCGQAAVVLCSVHVHQVKEGGREGCLSPSVIHQRSPVFAFKFEKAFPSCVN